MKKLLSSLIKKHKLFTKGVYDKFIYSNNHIDIIHDACKICYDKDGEVGIQAKLDYIKRRVATGHESILEHSNIVIYLILQLDIENLIELAEIETLCKYLNIKIKYIGKEIHFLIGGSIRGYKHIFRNIDNQDNSIAKIILNNLYNINKEYLNDFIEDEIMSESKFIDLDCTYPAVFNNKVLSANVSIVNMDDIMYIYNETNKIFSLEDLLDFCSITILFKDISRIISQQVDRHRNGITQLSQRYVDYCAEKFGFNSPDKYKDKYDVNYKYNIGFNGSTSELTLQELGDELMKIYNQLNDKSLGENRLIPEDARAYLPNNAQTSLYMTFTFKSLIAFLALRTDIHAQAEIRILAMEIQETVEPIINLVLGKSMYDTLTPEYKRTYEKEEYNIDEVIGEPVDEVIENKDK